MIPIACLRGHRTSRAQFVKFANVLWEPLRDERSINVMSDYEEEVMADIPFALHLLASASTGGFWGGGWSSQAGTAFTPEAGTGRSHRDSHSPGSPSAREDPLMERKD